MKKIAARAGVYAVVCVFFILTLAPLFMTLSISLQSESEIYSPTLTLVPSSPLFINYADAMAAGDWAKYFFNSVFIAFVVTAVSLLINSIAGYVFARVPFKYSGALFMLILVGMMIPTQTTMIPVYLMLRQIPFAGGNDIFGQGGRGLYDSLWGLILPFIAGSFGVFLCRQYYLTFPSELDDAAKIDGCGRFGAFLRVYAPLSGPLFASLGLLKFTGTWNEYTWPLIMTRSDGMKTVQLALAAFRNESGIAWSRLMAASVLTGLPVYALFFAAQKHFVAGLTAGSVKG